jgi:hypothetical protein
MADKKQSDQARAEQALIKIEKLGGHYVWERELFIVVLKGTNITDSDLGLFADLPLVEDIHLDNTNITDVGLKHLSELSRLKTLSLVSTKISDAAIQAFKNAKPKIKVVVQKEKPTGINPFTGKPFGE